MFVPTLGRLGPAVIVAMAIAGTVGCSLDTNLLGGREKCWPAPEQRAASLWRGILAIDESGARLETPEGEVIPLVAGGLSIVWEANGTSGLVRDSEIVARVGDDVTLFGGVGADGALQVCAVEEVHVRA